LEMESSYNLQIKDLDPQPDDYKRVEENKLGVGGFGKVYHGVYKRVKVAIKLIRDDIIEEESHKDILLKECQIMMQLHHPYLGRLYGFNLKKGSACMVMELAELGSLYDILKNKKKYPHLSWKRRLSIAIDILKGLSYLHDRDLPILHRDLKSLNVLLRKDWTAFITDFGSARIKITTQTLGTKGVGSFPWMAPEMSDPDAITTIAIDIFSFAMIMYELLMREVPFGIEKWSGAQITGAIIRGRRPIIGGEDKYNSMKDCPKGYQELMRECWDQDPLKRPYLDNILSRLDAMFEVSSACISFVIFFVLGCKGNYGSYFSVRFSQAKIRRGDICRSCFLNHNVPGKNSLVRRY